MEAMRQAWTDDRMDDLVRRVDTGFAQVDARFTEVHEDIAALRVDNKELRGEMAALDRDLRIEMKQFATRKEMRDGFDKVDERFDQVIATFNRRFDTLILTLITAMIAVVVTLIGS